MVDLSILQPVSQVAAAIGVCIAAFYYIQNLRETNKNRRITFTNSLMQPLMSEEGARRFIDNISMEWSDFEDFKKKYDSRVNPENFSKRMSLWWLFDSLGYLYRSNLIDLDTILGVSTGQIEYTWTKFKPIIYEYRKTDFGPGGYKNFEYLAEEMFRRRRKIEASVSDRLAQVTAEHTKRK